ncbi:MAG TPA: flagellar basal body rod protein FlgB [Verrucomicrobiae bacterium]|nr:flagellar basal body rod protein FlgB [Verrucomicrobiae bacterium]
MIDALFNQPNYVAAKKLLEATVLRHEALANNLANIETPGYRRVDIAPSFGAELQRALASDNVDAIAAVQPKLEVDSTALAQSPDGNTVKLESELVGLQQNTLNHTLATQLITEQLLRLQLAVTGRSQ